LKVLLIGGEPVPEAIWKVLSSSPGTSSWNLYGPTECTVDATAQEIRVEGFGTLIGSPLTCVTAHILDDEFERVPYGVAGELFIGGAGVGRGYLGDPELTAQRFVPDPFDCRGRRLYRTGDLARYTGTGEIEFLGRTDEQVKVRGARVEPREVEFALAEYSGIAQAVVVPVANGTEGVSLAAYIVPKSGAVLDAPTIRDFLRTHMPDGMLPAYFVPLKRIPTTANGKLDRRQLPDPRDGQVGGRDSTQPRTPTELQLALIWESTLPARSFGIRDNFFDLGGHSLLAVRIVSQINNHFGTKLPLAVLFENPTIETLAHMLAGVRSTRQPALVPIQPSGSKHPLFCIHPIGGGVFCYVPLARKLGVDQPCYGIDDLGNQDTDDPFVTIEELAARHLRAVREAQPEGPYQLAGWSFGGIVAIEMAQQLHKQQQEVRLLALIDCMPEMTLSLEALSDLELLRLMLRELPQGSSDSALSGGDDEQTWQSCLDMLKSAQVVPPEVGIAELREYLRRHRARLRARREYVTRVYPGRLLLLRASEMEFDAADAASPGSRAAFEDSFRDPTYGWSRFTKYPVEVHRLPGSHRTMLAPAAVEVMAPILRVHLDCGVSSAIHPTNLAN
jgi:thioesterase domain-containing protein